MKENYGAIVGILSHLKQVAVTQEVRNILSSTIDSIDRIQKCPEPIEEEKHLAQESTAKAVIAYRRRNPGFSLNAVRRLFPMIRSH